MAYMTKISCGSIWLSRCGANDVAQPICPCDLAGPLFGGTGVTHHITHRPHRRSVPGAATFFSAQVRDARRGRRWSKGVSGPKRSMVKNK